MRINEILAEEYAGATKSSFGDPPTHGEVFVNPEPSEIRDIDGDYGYRLLIDLIDKKFYATDGAAIHIDMMKDLNLGIDYFKVQSGQQYRFLTLSADNVAGRQFTDLFSDTFIYEIYRYTVSNTDEEKEVVLQNMNKMLEFDWDWVTSWVDPGEAKKFIIHVKELLEDDLNKGL